LETAQKLYTIILDTTGTVTEVKPSLTDVVAVNGFDENLILTLSASAEKASEHPLAEAIVKGAEERKLELHDPKNFNAIPGHGIEAEINARKVLLGNLKLMRKFNINLGKLESLSIKLADEGKTPMYVAIDNKAAGIVAVADVIKKDSIKKLLLN